MKFDCVIMNPPYCRNLHLKILAEAIKHLKDDESVCVNLSPILWLENPLAEYKLKSDYYRFKDLRMHIKEVNVVDVNSANKSFNIGLFCDLGVYVASKKENCEYTNVEILKQCLGKNYFILRKVLNTKTDKVSNHIKKGFNGICVKVATVRGFGSGNNFDIVSLIHSTPYINGKGYAENKFKKKDVIVKDDYSNEEFCHFNDEISATNFIKSTRTKFYHWLVKCIKLDQNIPLQFLPFMDDYTEPCSDERFYQFFNILPEEQKVIEDTMKKYS